MQRPDGISVIIPAHNEATILPRLLSSLAGGGTPPKVEVLVVANGCLDDTASVARSFRTVKVVEISEASKKAALAEGNRIAAFEARAYVDADVVISQRDLLELFKTVRDGAWLAAAPERALVKNGVSRIVQWYYDVWERLPQVRTGLFGRGVIVISAAGHARISLLPQVMSDDLLLSEEFTEDERIVVKGTQVSIWLPRSVADLLRRRIRVSTGNAEMDELDLRKRESRTSMHSVLGVLRESPGILPKIVIFLGIAFIARLGARRRVNQRDFTTWLRDESSRQA